MRRILDELEEEVYEINAEQQFLLLRLNDDLEGFCMKLKENNISGIFSSRSLSFSGGTPASSSWLSRKCLRMSISSLSRQITDCGLIL